MSLRFRAFIFIGDASEGSGKLRYASVIVVLAVSRGEAGGEGLLLLWRKWKLSHSQIPSYQRGHGGSSPKNVLSQPVSKMPLSCSATSI